MATSNDFLGTDAELARRVDAARSAGIVASLQEPSMLPESVTAFVDVTQVVSAAIFEHDGSADVRILTRQLRDESASRGARYCYQQEVPEIQERASGVSIVTTTGERYEADAVVLATGVWGTQLTGFELPLFPVAHPYVYSSPNPSWRSGPFVRWPEHHVYARVHGDRMGIGTYDHRPVGVQQGELIEGASLPWRDSFAAAIQTAQSLLRAEAQFLPDHRINGVFAMTPDNLPFLGKHPTMANVWIAQAIWVTHAAGAAERLADALLRDEPLPPQLAVNRFENRETDSLRERAMRLYRDIYANDA